MKYCTTKIITMVVTAVFALNTVTVSAHNRGSGASELSAISALPVASIVIAGSAVSAAVVAFPAVLSVTGAVLVVKSVEVSARGTICVLERASDGARVSVEITARGLENTALSVGKSVQIAVIGAGAVLSVAGEAIAFVPNEIGRALLHNERISN